MNEPDAPECPVCGKPATVEVNSHDVLPDESYWAIEADSPPWRFCEQHAGRQPSGSAS
jgi:hypothetical protein